ncbi:pirin family protein [Aliifodinibius sp. S!AR15-10]|uniref:pirin family protein n=1 Tax=Aliifodinibius sp. S!AR15-10 TaxID=2950437 RepID=UPI002860933B|nr:pirin family protein [Aliifodinibius sp. S!AR15-10]MDR8390790.1 pirin family protein [Aliifodinibius sp. S!AR15-10]
MIHISRSNKRHKVSRGPFTSRFLPLGRTAPDTQDHGIAQIGRLEHATLEAGALVPMHLHQNEEILSYLRKGTMHHKDSDQNDVPIHNKHLMLMNAGSGIHHEEGVQEGNETVEMLQIFIRPKADDLEPKVQFHDLDVGYSLNEWRLLAGHDRSGAPMLFRSEVLFHDLHLQEGNSIQSLELNELVGFMYLFSGSVTIEDNGEILEEGDSIIIKDERLTLTGNEDSNIVFFVLDETAPYSRNGLYTK